VSTEQEGKKAPRKRANRPVENRSGELWAKCPECRTPVKDVELFKHLLNCPGAEVRRAEWTAQQAAQQAAAQPDVVQ
jgi:acetyl-CoA carboxylase beta subunit